ncbi:MAG: type II secretion system F family protein [Clostridium sp.]|nr:type II secretion system F family protein [Bacteroides sp.]MCM1198660.1 type II secretion system F family protein [Clostridium sp.]
MIMGFWSRRNSLPDKDRKVFFSELHSLISSGLSLSRSFGLILDGAGKKERQVYSRVFDRVVSGSCLWQSMSHEACFSELDCSVVRIGEETGKLPDALSFLIDYYRKKEEQKRIIAGALSYPCITLCIAVAVLVFMLIAVVPMFEQVYARMGGELPGITRQIIAFSGKLPAAAGLLLTVLCAWSVVRHLWGGTERYRKFCSGVVMRIPLVGRIVMKYQVARFCRILHLLLSSDVRILEALDLMMGLVTFYPYNESMKSVCRTIERGGSMADGISSCSHLYGKRFIVLLRVAEETNTVDKVLLAQADETDRELDHEIRQLNSLAEPFLIVGIGIIVAFVLIAMYMPMFKLGMAM